MDSRRLLCQASKDTSCQSTHYPKIQGLTLVCEECGRRYISKKWFDEHIEKAHGNKNALQDKPAKGRGKASQDMAGGPDMAADGSDKTASHDKTARGSDKAAKGCGKASQDMPGGPDKAADGSDKTTSQDSNVLLS